MTYLPHIEKASSAARNVLEPLGNALEQIGTLRGMFHGSGGGNQVTMESALRNATRARYWLNTLIEELEAADKGMPEPANRDRSECNQIELTPAGHEALAHAKSGAPPALRVIVSGKPPIADHPTDDGPRAA